MELKNKTILITGGTKGIGLEFTKQLTQLGANIIVTGRDLEALEETMKKFPRVHTIQSDVSDPKDIEKLYKEVIRNFPDLSIIFNNAGLMRQIDLQDQTIGLQDITREIDTNLSGTIQLVHRFLPHLLTQGSSAIVNISSAIAFISYSIAPVYSASKAGVHAYTKALRLQLEKTHVKVFEVIPPGVNTSLQNDWILKPDAKQMMNVDKMVSDAIKGLLKDKKEITPGLAGVVRFLSRIAPSYMEKNLAHREFEKFRQLSKQISQGNN